MSLKDDLEAAKSSQPGPVLVPVTINGALYQVETKRLPGTVWDGIVARCPARAEQHFLVGYDTGRATRIALQEHGRLLNAEGDAVDTSPKLDERGNAVDDPWGDVLEAISGVELRAVSAAWWGLNEQDPDAMVTALKKASAGGASNASS